MAIPITCDQTTLSVDLTDWAAQVTSAVRANLDATPIEADLTANAISSVGAAVSVTVTPSSGTVPERAGSNYVRSFNKETGTFSITVLDSANVEVDLTDVYEDLGVYWETESRVEVGSVTSGITLGGTGNATLSFSLPTAVAATDQRLIFAVRERENDETVYLGGIWDVQYLPAGS